jgi:hypothetical protein
VRGGGREASVMFNGDILDITVVRPVMHVLGQYSYLISMHNLHRYEGIED